MLILRCAPPAGPPAAAAGGRGASLGGGGRGADEGERGGALPAPLRGMLLVPGASCARSSSTGAACGVGRREVSASDSAARSESRSQARLARLGAQRIQETRACKVVKYCTETRMVLHAQKRVSPLILLLLSNPDKRSSSRQPTTADSSPLELAAKRSVCELSARRDEDGARRRGETHPWHLAKRYSRPLTLTRPSLSVTFHLFLTRCTFSYRAMTRSALGSAPSTSSSSSSSSSSSRSELMASSLSSSPAAPSAFGLAAPLTFLASCCGGRVRGSVRERDESEGEGEGEGEGDARPCRRPGRAGRRA